MNLGLVGPEIADGFGAHRSSSASSGETSDASPQAAAQGRRGLFDDLIDALAAQGRGSADDDPTEQPPDGCVVPFQLPLTPQETPSPAPSENATKKTAAPDQAQASAIDSTISSAIALAAQAHVSAVLTTPLPIAQQATASADAVASAMPQTAQPDQRDQTDPTEQNTEVSRQQPRKNTQPTADASSVLPRNVAVLPAQPADPTPDGASPVDAAPSGTKRSEPAPPLEQVGGSKASRAAHRYPPGSVNRAAPHTPRIAAGAESQASGATSVHVSHAQVRLMNAQTANAPADSAQISEASIGSVSDAERTRPELAASSVAPIGGNPAKSSAAAGAPPQTVVTAPLVTVPIVAAPAEGAGIRSTRDAASAAPPEAAPDAAPVDAMQASEPSQQTKPAETTLSAQESVAPLPPSIAVAQSLPSNTAAAIVKAAQTRATRAEHAELLDQRAVEKPVEPKMSATEVRPVQIEDVVAQQSPTNPATKQSSREEQPVRAAEYPATPAPAREQVQPRIDAEARPETAQRLLERAIASQQPAEPSRGRDAAPGTPAPASDTSTAGSDRPAFEQSSTGGQHPHDESHHREWVSATPTERASSPLRRTSDSRDAPEIGAPASSGTTSRGTVLQAAAATALLQPQLAPVVATSTASTMTGWSMPAPDTADRIVQSMRMQYQRGGGDAVLQIRPEHLGPVTISLRVENGVVSAVVSADHPATAEWLQSNQQSLKESLQQSGLQLERFVVQRDGQSPSDRQRREWSDARRRDVRRRAPQQDSTFEITI